MKLKKFKCQFTFVVRSEEKKVLDKFRDSLKTYSRPDQRFT